MWALRIEHRFADVIGATGRGHVADADYIRRANPQYLAKALAQAISALTSRAAKLPESDPKKVWIEHTVEVAENIKKNAETSANDQFPTLLFWKTSADSLHWAHLYLEGKGL